MAFAEGRSTDAWDHTAPLLALLFNANRGKGVQPLTVEDIHPYRKKVRKRLTRESLRALKPLFQRGT